MVSMGDEYKYKQLVKTTFKSCGKPMFLEIYSSKMPISSQIQPVSPTNIDRMGYYLGPIVEFL